VSDRTKLERETGILWNESEESAVLWTLSESVKRRMTLILGPPTSERGPCQEWAFPKSWVKLPRKPRQLSAEAKAKAAERLKIVREGQ
jgi:hypothetical protein